MLYTNARAGTATLKLDQPGTDLRPLFETILAHLPGPEVDPEATSSSRSTTSTTTTTWAVSRLAGSLRDNSSRAATIRFAGPTALASRARSPISTDGRGLKRVEQNLASAGEIVMVAGMEEIEIGDTIADLENPRPLPGIRIDEPTVAMTFSVNNSPWAGREGTWVTSRKLGERIDFESRRNVSVRVEQTSAEAWRVMGRGELQLAVILETMRREGYELQVSKPTVLTRQEDGALLEPMEFLVVDVPEDYIGTVTQSLSVRKGRMRTMETQASGRVRLEYDVPARGLIGFRGRFLAETRGLGVLHTIFNGYAPWCGSIRSRQNGAMISDREGLASGYAIFHLQERGRFFINAGEPVYEGMIVGEYSRETNLPVNVCREKKLTNIRAAGHDEAIRLTPARAMGLDAAIEWIDEEELVELTPKSVRIRNRILKTGLRSKHRAGWSESAQPQVVESD